MDADRSSNRAILIIDDDADLRETLSDVLREAGYEVTAAGDGREGLRILDEGSRPDLILLDMMMPEMNGWQFRAEQQKRPEWAAIPTVIFSAYGDLGETVKALNVAGALKKPLRMRELLDKMQRFIPLPGEGKATRDGDGLGGVDVGSPARPREDHPER